MTRLGAVIARRLAALASADPRIWILDGDLGDSYGVDELAAGALRERFIQAGIAEQTMIGVAAGLAACGQRPWVFSFAAFLCCRAYDQIRVSVSQTRLPVVLVGSHAGGCGAANGKTHIILNDVAIMASLPDIEVWAPADAADAVYAAAEAVAAPSAVYIRVPRDAQTALGGEPAVVRTFGDPSGAVLVATGAGTQWAMRVRALLRARGLDIAVVHVLRLAPFPVRELEHALAAAGRAIVIEDHYDCGGLADMIRRELPALEVTGVGWPRHWSGSSGSSGDLRSACGIDEESIVDLCLQVLAQRSAAPRATSF